VPVSRETLEVACSDQKSVRRIYAQSTHRLKGSAMAADTDPIRLTLTMSPSLNAKLE
jgi:hypothetical protein